MASTVLVFRNCCKSVRQLGLSYSTSSLIKSDASISLADKRMHAIDDLQHLFSSSSFSSSVTCSRSQHSCLPSLFYFLHFRLSKGGWCSLQSWRLDPWPAMYLFHCCTSQQFDLEAVWITNDICLLCKGWWFSRGNLDGLSDQFYQGKSKPSFVLLQISLLELHRSCPWLSVGKFSTLSLSHWKCLIIKMKIWKLFVCASIWWFKGFIFMPLVQQQQSQLTSLRYVCKKLKL
jgi:hypothetical protein